MALSDHDWNERGNAAWSRSTAGEIAPADRPVPAFLRSLVNLPKSGNDNSRPAFLDDPALELDCLRNVLAPELLRAAERRSRELGVGADQVLIHWGVIDEDAYLRRLSFHTGIEIEDFAGIGRDDCPLDDDGLLSGATHGILRLHSQGRSIHAFAPRRLTARTLCHLIDRYPGVRPNLRLMTASSLQQFLTRQCGHILAYKATQGLTDKYPSMSARAGLAHKRGLASVLTARLRRRGARHITPGIDGKHMERIARSLVSHLRRFASHRQSSGHGSLFRSSRVCPITDCRCIP